MMAAIAVPLLSIGNPCSNPNYNELLATSFSYREVQCIITSVLFCVSNFCTLKVQLNTCLIIFEIENRFEKPCSGFDELGITGNTNIRNICLESTSLEPCRFGKHWPFQLWRCRSFTVLKPLHCILLFNSAAFCRWKFLKIGSDVLRLTRENCCTVCRVTIHALIAIYTWHYKNTTLFTKIHVYFI